MTLPSSMARWTTVLLFAILTLVRAYEAENVTSSTDMFMAPMGARYDHLFEARSPKEKHSFTVVAIGDLHGDFESTKELLEGTHVTKNGQWTGNVDILIQLGDVMDRGPDGKAIYKHLNELRNQANKRGQHVFTVWGNHEFMNALGHWQCVNRGEIGKYKDRDARLEDILVGDIGKLWAEHNLAALRIPLHPSLGAPNSPFRAVEPESKIHYSALAFVHGGLAPHSKELDNFPTDINNLAASLFSKVQKANPRPAISLQYPYVNHYPPDVTEEEKRFFGPDGPLWYSGWARVVKPASKEAEKELCAEADKVLKKIGARRMIMGHMIQPKITTRCNGKIILIDTRISRYMQGERLKSALRIFYRVVHNEKTGKWYDSELATAYTVDEGHYTQLFHAIDETEPMHS